jgi:hypothetical protein
MPAIFLTLLKLIFLGLIYLFLWQVARAVGGAIGATELGRRERRAGGLVLIRSESQAGARIDVSDAVVIGRSPEAGFVIDDPYASDYHARVSVAASAMTITDLGSTNGTYVDGRRITAPTGVTKGDTVQIGKTIMEVR